LIQQNIIANLIGRAWGFISLYLFVPLYLKFLGIEAYGLVGFYSLLLGVLSFADMGFTATISREMARLSVMNESAGETRDLLRTYESTHFFISSSIAILIWLLAPPISQQWLRAEHMSHAEITWAVRLMGVAIAVQMPAGLYLSGLMGLQRQVLANSIQIAWGIFRGGGAVMILWLFSPTIFAFALWQVISNAIYCFLVRYNLWRVLSFNSTKPRFNYQVFRSTWRYSAGMLGMSFISMVLTQTDKLVVSKILPLEMLGYYTLAGALATGLISLGSPIAMAVFPRMTGLYELDAMDGLIKLYHRSCELVAVAVIPVGLALIFFSREFIFVWTGSPSMARRVGPVASLLLGGQLLQAIMVMPYYLSLAHGSTKMILKVGITSTAVVIPLLIILTSKYGIEGAGMSWLIMNICTVPPYMFFLHRRFLPSELWKWFARSVVRPLLVPLPLILIGYLFMPRTDSRLLTFCLIGLILGISMLVTASTVLEIRNTLKRQAYKLFGGL
jgi:O-antigen/teichoic acid export membrane protein